MGYRKNKILLLVRVVLIALASFCCISYFTSKKIIETKSPVDYTFISQSQSFWRGTSYKISIIYNQEKYNVAVSRETSDSIKVGIMPSLYYDDLSSSIIYEYHLLMMLRVLFALLILFVLTFLPKKRSST